MKKILLLLILVIVLAVAGAGIFLATFDLNQYRGRIVEEIEKATGKPVSLEKISLGWHDGIALELEGFRVMTAPGSREALAELGSLHALLDWRPLLNRELKIKSIVFSEPRLRLVGTPDGGIRGFETAAAEAPEAPGGALAAVTLVIQSVRIENGIVSFQPAGRSPAERWEVRDIDIELTDVALARPVGIRAAASFLSDSQNLQLSGEARFSLRDQALHLKGVRLSSDLSKLDVGALQRRIPGLAEAGIEKPVRGQISVDVSPLVLGTGRLDSWKVAAALREGRLKTASLGAPIEAISTDLSLTPRIAEVTGFSAAMAGGRLAASGHMRFDESVPKGEYQLTLAKVALEELLPDPGAGMPKPEGRAFFSMRGGYVGGDWASIQRTMVGQGQLSVQEGVIRNLNVIREMMRALSVIPGLMKKLEARLPETYKERLEENDTVFESIEIPLTIHDGIVDAEQINIVSKHFYLTGGGRVSLSGPILAQARLHIDPELSEAMSRSVEELRYLADAQGRLGIPVKIDGMVTHPKILPDLGYIASRLAVSKATDWLSGVLGETTGQGQAQTSGSDAQSPGGTSEGTNAQTQQSEPVSPVLSLLNQFLAPPPEESSKTSAEAA